jgi:hypothetical protein
MGESSAFVDRRRSGHTLPITLLSRPSSITEMFTEFRMADVRDQALKFQFGSEIFQAVEYGRHKTSVYDIGSSRVCKSPQYFPMLANIYNTAFILPSPIRPPSQQNRQAQSPQMHKRRPQTCRHGSDDRWGTLRRALAAGIRAGITAPVRAVRNHRGARCQGHGVAAGLRRPEAIAAKLAIADYPDEKHLTIATTAMTHWLRSAR